MSSRHREAQQAATKTCTVCGRRFAWRAEWARNWEQVRYCSDACRKRAGSNQARGEDAALEAAILALLSARGRDKTICPSEAARQIAGEAGRDDWKALMEPARAAARRLQASGRLRILQHGDPVDPSCAKGPIRLQLV